MVLYISAAGYELVIYCFDGQKLTTEVNELMFLIRGKPLITAELSVFRILYITVEIHSIILHFRLKLYQTRFTLVIGMMNRENSKQ